jgi:hypothetical protein
MINGETIGIWSIKHKSKISEVTVTGFEPLTADQQLAIQSAITNYQKYLAKQICLSMV